MRWSGIESTIAPSNPIKIPVNSKGSGNVSNLTLSIIQRRIALMLIRADTGPAGPWEKALIMNTKAIALKVLPTVPTANNFQEKLS